MGLLRVALVLVVVVLAACGDDAGEPGTTGSEPPTDGETSTAPTTAAPATTQPATTAPPETTTTQPPIDSGIVTEEDDAAVIEMQQGDEVQLQLSSDWAWEQPVADGAAVELVEVNYLVDPGFMEWLVVANAPGTVEVVATGSPNCADANRCPPREVSFTFTVSG